MGNKQSFVRAGPCLVSILLKPWRDGESVASLSSEITLQAWAYKKAKVFLAFSRRQSINLKICSIWHDSRVQ